MRAPLLIGCAVLSLSACSTVGPVAQALMDTTGEVSAPPPREGEPEIPQRQRAPEQRDQGPPEARPVETRDQSTPREDASLPRLHTARDGETLESIAAQYGEAVETLEQMNGLSPPYEVRAGDVIVLPERTQTAGPAPLIPPVESAPLPPAREIIEASRPVAPRPAAPRLGAHFTRPVEGDVRARFGAQSDGRRLDGVEFAAGEGAPIHAAADGTVVYAGSLAAYDNLLLVRHADGYVTAYGYARRLLVSEGAAVRAGQTVAEAGSRGRVLFQVRQGTTAVDPLPLLGE